MANKDWAYIVTVYSPTEMEKTPSQRTPSNILVQATSAKRAISKAEKLAAEKAGWSRKDYEIVEAVIDRSHERNAPDLPWEGDEDDDDADE